MTWPSPSKCQVWNSNLNQDQAGLFYPKEAHVSSATEFLCRWAPAPGQWCCAGEVAPWAGEWCLEINIESCAWSGCHQESAVAPHLQTAPRGCKKKTKRSECLSDRRCSHASLTHAQLWAPWAHFSIYPQTLTPLHFNHISFLPFLLKTLWSISNI